MTLHIAEGLDLPIDYVTKTARWDVPFFFKQVGGRTPTAGGCELDGREHHAFPQAACR